MIQTLTGANSFALQAVLQKHITDFVAEHGDLALERLDGQEASYEKMAQALTSLPFLATRKLVVLRAPSANKKFAEDIEQLFDQVDDATDVIVVEPKLDKRLSYYKYLKKKTGFQEFFELDSNGLASWLVAQAKSQDGSISSSDARYLIDRVGASQQLLSNELEKLLLYEPKITRQAIDLQTEANPQSTIFQLLEAGFAGRTKQALSIYAEQRALKVEPQQIIAMLAWQLQVLAIIKMAGDRSTDTIAKDAKLNPFVVSKSQGIARKLSNRTVRTLVKDLLVIDAKSKSSAIDLDEALQHYLLQLAN